MSEKDNFKKLLKEFAGTITEHLSSKDENLTFSRWWKFSTTSFFLSRLIQRYNPPGIYPDCF